MSMTMPVCQGVEPLEFRFLQYKPIEGVSDDGGWPTVREGEFGMGLASSQWIVGRV